MTTEMKATCLVLLVMAFLPLKVSKYVVFLCSVYAQVICDAKINQIPNAFELDFILKYNRVVVV
jgi:hypothetical protein